MMKHNLLMIIGCGLPLLLIFLLPALGMGTGWVFAVAFVAMVACHLMHFGTHNHRERETTNMSIHIDKIKLSESGSSNPISSTIGARSSARLRPLGLGFGLGSTGVVFYLGCILTMATVPREKAVFFFNSLLHGLNVEPILKTRIPGMEVLMGLTTTFIMGWFAGVFIAGFYNLVICSSRSQNEVK